MKRFLLLVAIGIVLISCKKEPMLIIGHYYKVKGGVFNTGVYRPVCPCRLDSLYIDPISHMPYAMIWGGQTGFPHDYDPNQLVHWYLPQEDLQ